jgi:hypothetical protein
VRPRRTRRCARGSCCTGQARGAGIQGPAVGFLPFALDRRPFAFPAAHIGTRLRRPCWRTGTASALCRHCQGMRTCGRRCSARTCGSEALGVPNPVERLQPSQPMSDASDAPYAGKCPFGRGSRCTDGGGGRCIAARPRGIADGGTVRGAMGCERRRICRPRAAGVSACYHLRRQRDTGTADQPGAADYVVTVAGRRGRAVQSNK